MLLSALSRGGFPLGQCVLITFSGRDGFGSCFTFRGLVARGLIARRLDLLRAGSLGRLFTQLYL